MPQRKRYSLTAIGEELCQKSARELLVNIETYYFDLTEGLVCRFFLSEEEFHLIIQERLDKLNIFIGA